MTRRKQREQPNDGKQNGRKRFAFPSAGKYNSERETVSPRNHDRREKQEKIYRNTIGNSGGAAQTELYLGLFIVPDAVNNITLSLFVL